MQFRGHRTCAFTAAAIAAFTPAHASLTAGEGRQLSASCASCHGAAGPGSAIPAIAGQDKTHIVQAMLAFRAGTREGPIMHVVASALSPDEIAALAQYLSTEQTVPQERSAGAPP